MLEEPYLAREESPDLGALEEALEVLAGGPKLALWLTFGNAQRVLAQGVADLPVHAIGIDFYATAATRPAGELRQGAARRSPRCAELGARGTARDRSVRRELRERGVEEIALVPNGDLQYVSEQVAREKLGRLGKAKTATTEAAA